MAEAQKEGTPKKPLDMGKILMFGIFALNLAAVGGAGFLIYSSTLGYKAPVLKEAKAMKKLMRERAAAENSQPVLYTMDGFVVNLSGPQRQALKVELTLEMLDEQGFEEVVTLNPAARDSIVRILSAKSFRELESIQGKLFLKDEIAVALNQYLKKGVVKDIYFNDFVVQ